MSNHKICILYSGGLDSLIMKRYAEVNYPDSTIHLQYYDIGHEHNFKEIETLPTECDVKTVEWLGNGVGAVTKENTQNIMIPGRNLALSVLAACQTLADEIWLGALMGEAHSDATDKNLQFLETMNTTLNYVLAPYMHGRTIKVRFPFVDANMGKLEVTRWFLDNGGTPEEVIGSSSCLSGETSDASKNCGQCIVCLRRWGIFTQLGISETYVHDPVNDMSPQNKKMVKEMLKGDAGHYDVFRRSEIIPALESIGFDFSKL